MPDISLNNIDLLYLTRPRSRKIFENIEHNKLCILEYKDQILEITKQLLENGEKTNTHVKEAFYEYAEICIQHIQFMKKSALIQQDYLHIKSKNKTNLPPMSLEESNKLITKQSKHKTMLDYISIVKKSSPFLPRIKNINNKYGEIKNENEKIPQGKLCAENQEKQK